ncbi:ankyrin repeat domain-containing protein [Polaribacter sp. Asnod1-A03]|uniref:ankyrin repeat domain-containing protein n=1 Tax=Polaribacter sp. Asnod1-A03 TaxID=3160581 RepID=UPI0038653721
MKYLNKITILLAFISISTIAQKKNIFLERDFWSSNPTITMVDQKIAEGNDVTESTSNAFDAIVYAINAKADNDVIKYLITKNNDVNRPTHDGRSYLHWAAYTNNLEVMKFLVAKGVNTKVLGTHGFTFMTFAANSGVTDIDFYKYSFEIGADITKEKNHDGANALLLVAPHLKDFTLVDFLTTKGVSINNKDNYGNGFFEYAAKGGNKEFLSLLVSKGIDKGNNAMLLASQGGRRKQNTLETYQFLEKIGVNPNIVNEEGKNPLHLIARNNKDIAIYKYFIEKGVDVNLQDKEGNSPFTIAASSAPLKVVTFLSKEVKDINQKNKKGATALTNAVEGNSVDVINFLIEKGADVNTLDNDGNTLSYYLIKNFSSRRKGRGQENKPNAFETKLQVLEKNGLVINKRQNSGNTLMHIAAEENNLALLKRLAVYKIDVNTKNKEDLTALQIAAMKAKDNKIIKYLLSVGADKNVKTDFDETVYDLASENELLKKESINFLK